MSTERKQQLQDAAAATATNIEIAEFLRQAIAASGDDAGVTNINADINCLQRWQGFDLQLAENEPEG